MNSEKLAKRFTSKTFKKIMGVKVTIEDFEMIKPLGIGATAEVKLARFKINDCLYAIKIIQKHMLDFDNKQYNYVKTEKATLSKNTSPFLMGLEFCFQDEKKVYFVMDFMQGGTLGTHLERSLKRFTEQEVRILAVQIMFGIEAQHEMNLIYRDLKPNNILIDNNGYLILADFGVCKQLNENQVNTTSYNVGTNGYMAPEIRNFGSFDNVQYSKSVDWWSFGIIIYEMLYESLPFQQSKNELSFPVNERKLSESGKDFIKKLLVSNPIKRLGHKEGTAEIKRHPWLNEIDFDKIFYKRYEKKIIEVNVKKSTDLTYFENDSMIYGDNADQTLFHFQKKLIQRPDNNIDNTKSYIVFTSN